MAFRFLKDLLRRDGEDRTVPIVPLRLRTENPFQAVSIHPGDPCCEAARQMSSIRYLCASAPRIPLPECDVSNCTCRYKHFSDRRGGQDRRSAYDWTRQKDLDSGDRRSGRGRRSTDGVA
jgi:hypothetical protein